AARGVARRVPRGLRGTESGSGVRAGPRAGRGARRGAPAGRGAWEPAPGGRRLPLRRAGGAGRVRAAADGAHVGRRDRLAGGRAADARPDDWVVVAGSEGFTTERGQVYAFKARREFDDAGLAAFAKVPPDAPVIRIDLRGTRITDAGLVHLEHLANVEALDLG